MAPDVSQNQKAKIPQQWLTHFELSGQKESPRYAETMAYFNKLAAESPDAKMFTFGVSPQGRDMNYLVVANGSEFAPQQAHSSWKAIVMIQNGIHAGEIEGKDACMMLLREILITKEKEHLLDKLILLVIPILNVDGHERVSPANRPNQNGPVEMGWRTTSHNLNLNRDYVKADAPEMQALLKLYSYWLPDFLIDNHTTNGLDYQYHITYGLEKHQNIDSGLAEWGSTRLMPNVLSHVEERGFLTGPYIDVEDDIRKGFSLDASLPRYSTGYAAAQNRLCLLVETHSLKPFGTRVYATKAMNEAVLEYVNANADHLKKLNSTADSDSIQQFCTKHQPFPVEIATTDKSVPFLFKGLKSRSEESPLTGSSIIRYTSTPIEFEVPLFDHTKVTKSIVLPRAYCIPEEFTHLAYKLQLHGVEVETLEGSLESIVERYRFGEVRFAEKPYEGRQQVTFTVESFQEKRTLPHGIFIVIVAQRAVRVLAHLLEPESPDSFARWGFFNAFFERKEYAEPYIMEPIAQEMMQKDAALREEFYKRINEDESFRDSPTGRLEFFYRRSPYFDVAEGIYPIMRIVDAAAFEHLTHSLA